MKTYPKNPNSISFPVALDRLNTIKQRMGASRKLVGTPSGPKFNYAVRYKLLLELGWRTYYDNNKKVQKLSLSPFPSAASKHVHIYFGAKDRDMQSYIYRDWEYQPDDLFRTLNDFVSYLFHLGWIRYEKDYPAIST